MPALFRLTFLLAVTAFFFSLSPVPAQAAIYTFVDEHGVYHATNVPTDPRYRPKYGKEITKSSIERNIRRAARRYSVDPLLVKAVIRAESNFNHLAVSRKGAKGLMQLMPETIHDMRVRDPFDPAENIAGGTHYLRLMLDAFQGDLSLALAAYNAGPDIVRKLGRVPAIPETLTYVRKVLDTYQRLQNNPSLALY
ncbi:MAG: transglycosylase SLT domain-containing protein [Deltaproteobacteria bacterium]